MKGIPAATVRKVDHTPELEKAIRAFKSIEVLVGIPEGDAHQGVQVSNAKLGYIHEKGSPASNIPPRPFLVPGVQKSEKRIESGLRSALKDALSGDVAGGEARLEALGLQVAAGVKKYMSTADFEPLKLSTIANRNRSRSTKTKRVNEKRFIKRGGKLVPNPKFGVGIKPLINTGALRNSIDSFVVKGK